MSDQNKLAIDLSKNARYMKEKSNSLSNDEVQSISSNTPPDMAETPAIKEEELLVKLNPDDDLADWIAKQTYLLQIGMVEEDPFMKQEKQFKMFANDLTGNYDSIVNSSQKYFGLDSINPQQIDNQIEKFLYKKIDPKKTMQRLCYAKAPSVSPYATYYENRDELTKLVEQMLETQKHVKNTSTTPRTIQSSIKGKQYHIKIGSIPPASEQQSQFISRKSSNYYPTSIQNYEDMKQIINRISKTDNIKIKQRQISTATTGQRQKHVIMRSNYQTQTQTQDNRDIQTQITRPQTNYTSRHKTPISRGRSALSQNKYQRLMDIQSTKNEIAQHLTSKVHNNSFDLEEEDELLTNYEPKNLLAQHIQPKKYSSLKKEFRWWPLENLQRFLLNKHKKAIAVEQRMNYQNLIKKNVGSFLSKENLNRSSGCLGNRRQSSILKSKKQQVTKDPSTRILALSKQQTPRQSMVQDPLKENISVICQCNNYLEESSNAKKVFHKINKQFLKYYDNYELNEDESKEKQYEQEQKEYEIAESGHVITDFKKPGKYRRTFRMYNPREERKFHTKTRSVIEQIGIDQQKLSHNY